MRYDWLKEIIFIMKKEIKDDLLNEMKSMINEELTIEKENFNEAVRNIKMLNEKVEVCVRENKELKDKIDILNVNKMLNEQLSSKFDELKRNLLACGEVVSSEQKHSEIVIHENENKELKHKIDASSKLKDSMLLSDINTKLSIVTENINDENERQLINKKF